MSYDVEVSGEWANYTNNLRQFFIDFDAYPPDWDGKPKAEVANLIGEALAQIAERPFDELKAKYDAANGWGSVETAIAFLESVLDACRRDTDTVRVSW